MVFIKALISVLVASTFIGCDKREPPKVPSRAAERFAPADVRPPRPVVDAGTKEAIVAWVNGEPIELQELERRLEQVGDHYRRQRKPFGPRLREQKRQQVLQRLVDLHLIEQWLDVEVSDDQVDEELESRTREKFGGSAALKRHLAQRQISIDEYRERLRRDLALDRALGARIELDDEAAETELRELYAEVANRPPDVTRYRLTSIIFGRDVDRAAVADRLREVKTPADFARLAREFPSARLVELEWVEQSSMREALSTRVAKVAPPGVTSAVSTPGGFEAYWVHERSVEPTDHFRELEPTLRRRARALRETKAREKLVRELRAAAEIRYADEESPPR